MYYEREMIAIATYIKLVLNIEFEIYLTEENRCARTDGHNIYVSKKWLRVIKQNLEIIPMICHEAFHIWQRHAVLYEMVSLDKIILWQTELTNYNPPEEGTDIYLLQDIERTATIFSDIVLYKLTGIHLDVIGEFSDEEINFVKSLDFDFHEEIYRISASC